MGQLTVWRVLVLCVSVFMTESTANKFCFSFLQIFSYIGPFMTDFNVCSISQQSSTRKQNSYVFAMRSTSVFTQMRVNGGDSEIVGVEGQCL